MNSIELRNLKSARQQVERNVKSVRQQVVWLNAHDIDGFVSDLADDFVWKSDVLPEPDVGIEGAREGLALVYEVFPNIHFEELEIYPSMDSVIGVFNVSGTEIGHMDGALLPAVKDHPWHVNQAIIHTFDKNGKMKMVWLFTNVAYLLQQLGVLPKDLTTFGVGAGQSPGKAPPDFHSDMGYHGADPGPRPMPVDPFHMRHPDSLIDTFIGVVQLPVRILYESLSYFERWSGMSGEETPLSRGGRGNDTDKGFWK